MSVKINKLEIENVKRIKAVKLEPTANGLTVIGGRNNQGKTRCWIPLRGHWVAKISDHQMQRVMDPSSRQT